MNEELIREEHYIESMQTVVEPYLKQRRKSGYIEPVQGQRLYYEHYEADHPRAVVVMLHGFSEGIGKFAETAYYFLQRGYNVWQLQQRGHGLSWRGTEDPMLIYLDDPRRLVKDLRYFVKKVVEKDPGSKKDLPRYLYGHSMGGGVSALYLECYPEDFSKAVLSSPMLEMNSGKTPVWAAALYARAMMLMGRGENDMPGAAPFSETPDFEGSCTDSLPRYLYWLEIQKADPKMQMCVPAIRTAFSFLELTKQATKPSHCARVHAKVLLLQAGRDNMVCPGGQEKYIRQIGPRGHIVRFEEARHEIYRCSDPILERYWQVIDAFLEESEYYDRTAGV